VSRPEVSDSVWRVKRCLISSYSTIPQKWQSTTTGGWISSGCGSCDVCESNTDIQPIKMV